MAENHDRKNSNQNWNWIKDVLSLAKAPFLLIFIVYGIYAGTIFLVPHILPGFSIEIKAIFSTLAQIVLIFGLYWFFLKCLTYARFQLQIYLKKTNGKTAFLLLDFFIAAFKIIILLSLISFIIDLLPLPPQYNYFTERLIGTFIIVSIASILIKIVKVVETIVLAKYKVDVSDDLIAHKARTQIMVLGKIAIAMIVIVSFGSILLLFETVKHLGASILTTAGILSLISTIAIQKPLRNLADNLQIIFNRLIKIHDTVLIENELGTIEEINLYYVVIRIWDLRTLIVPISYFVEKPFINLSRTSKEILCTIKLYVDYTLPLKQLREILNEIANKSPFWNKKVCKLEVTDSKEFTMELRILLSAKTSGEAWDLQCEVREKFIGYISEKYPNHLPKLRTIASN